MKTKSLVHRILAMTISLCIIIAYTPVGAFAAAEDNSQDEISVQTEQTTYEQSQTTDNSDTSKTKTSDGQKPADKDTTGAADTNIADSKSVNISEDGGQAEYGKETNGVADQSGEAVSVSETPTDTELELDGTGSQPISAPAEENGILATGEQIHVFSDDYDEDDESISDAEMPAVLYIIAVLFKGIKKASLISSKYKITFDGVTFYQNGEDYSYYQDKVSFTKDEASILYDKYHNVILLWLFDGHGVDEEGNDTYTVLDMDTARQSHTHIPGYTFKGSQNLNFDFNLSLSWGDEEFDLLYAGVSVTANTYKKTGYAASAAKDHSPETGDYQAVGLFSIMMCLSLLGVLLIVLTGRRRRA